MYINLIILGIGALLFFAHLFNKLFDHTKIPDVLLLLLTGVLIGPILGIIKASDFGGVGKVFVILALIVILFESGSNLDMESISNSAIDSIKLTLINFILTVLFIGSISYFIFKLDIGSSFIFGSILGGTSSAVVIPLLNKIKLRDDSKTALLLESTFSDVLCIIFTIGAIESIKFGAIDVGLLFGKIMASFIMASLIGLVFSFVWLSFLYKVRKLENNIFLTQAFVFIIYSITEILGFSGAISALVFGFGVSNMKFLNLDKINPSINTKAFLSKKEKAFTNEIVFIIKTFLFVFIGISIQLNNIKVISISLILTIILYLARIIVVKLSFKKDKLKEDMLIASIMTPKGLAAAVLASLPLKAGLESGEFILSSVYSVILFSISLTSLLVFLFDKTSIKRVYYLFFNNYSIEETRNLKKSSEGEKNE